MTSLTVSEELAGPLSAEGIARSTVAGAPLGAGELNRIDAFWRACKYLALGMIYLQANPLLREPLKPEHIKSRLLGHWGSSPGLAFLYTHLSRLIKRDDLEMIFLAGPGHGAPGVLAPIYLEGTYSEIYPEKSQDEKGLREFFKQFSFPGGIGSHCTPETPGSIHEGGELGYVLSHACGAAFDNPELIVAAVVGDGEAETGPLATSWHISKFLNPIRDGAVSTHTSSQRIQDQQSHSAGANHSSKNWKICYAGMDGIPTSWRDPITTACIRQWPRRLSSASRKLKAISRSAGRAALPHGRAGRWWYCAHQRDGAHRWRWTDIGLKASGVRTRFR